MVNEESIDKLKNMVSQLIKTEEEVVDLRRRSTKQKMRQ
jgi:hypothetical protein